PASEPEIELVGSVKVTEPLGALADNEATEMAAGSDPPISCAMLPLAALRIRIPAEALIGASMKILWSAANVRLLELLQVTGAATVIVPARGAAAPEEVVTVTFPRPSSFCRSVTDKTDEA